LNFSRASKEGGEGEGKEGKGLLFPPRRLTVKEEKKKKGRRERKNLHVVVA